MREVARRRTRRVAGVTVGLTVAGALAGAIISSATLAILGVLVDGPGGFPHVWDAFVLAAVVGGALGGVLTPSAAWILLRRVPIGRAFGITAISTAVGGAVGLLASALNPLVAIGGAVIGFAVSVGWLRRKGHRSTEVVETGALQSGSASERLAMWNRHPAESDGNGETVSREDWSQSPNQRPGPPRS